MSDVCKIDDDNHDFCSLRFSLTPSFSRQELYLSGGLLSVTSRILVVDMLNKMIPTDLITGLVVLHAER